MASKASILLFCLVVGCCKGAEQISKGYSFSYTADDSTRNEAADDEGSVQGTYTYIDDDGFERTVRYLASGATGFEAEGEGILNVPRLIEETRARQAVEGVYEPTAEELASWATADRSYSLSYHAGDSARSEVSRADGYVTGSYSYLDRDGTERIVEYEAGPGIGFRVKGEHIHPKIASDSVPSQFERPNLVLSEYTLRSGEFEYEPSNIQKIFNADGTITYSYEAIDHSRSETVGPNGEVRGTYSYIGEDGQTHTVEYVGGSGVGFRVSGDHISSNVGRLSASAIRDLTRTDSLTGRGGAASGAGHFSGLGSGGSRVGTTHTETVTGIRGAAASGGHLGVVGSGGSRIDTTHTETITGIRGTAATGGHFDVLGSGGSRLDTTRSEVITGVRSATDGHRGVLGSGDSRIAATDTVTGARVTGTPFGVLGSGGSRLSTTHTETVRELGGVTGADGHIGVLGSGGSRIDTTRRIITGARGSALSGGSADVGSAGSRVDTTHTETITGIRGTAATGGHLNILGSGGSGTGITRTETVTEIRGSGSPTGFRGPVFGGVRGTTRITGVRGEDTVEGSRVETTQTQSLTGRQPVLLPSILEGDNIGADGRRVVITRTTTENRLNEVGRGGTRRTLSGVRQFGTGQQGSLQSLSGNRFGTDSAGRRIVTTETRRIARPQPIDLASIVNGAAGLAAGRNDQAVTTVRRTVTKTGNQLDHQGIRSGPVGPHFIKFSTQDGRRHELNLDRSRS